MSTTLLVYPDSKNMPSFSDILELTNQHIINRFHDMGIVGNVKFSAQMRAASSHEILNFRAMDELCFDDDKYAWFYIDGICGGIDVYFFKNDPNEVDYFFNEPLIKNNVKQMKNVIISSLTHGFHWCFRKSAGQRPIIALTYGILAASVAQLTHGFIISDDGAWDYSLFPCNSEKFLKHYFMPALSAVSSIKNYSEKCIQSLLNDTRLNSNADNLI